MRSLLIQLSATLALLVAPCACGSDTDGGSSPSTTSAGSGGSASSSTTSPDASSSSTSPGAGPVGSGGSTSTATSGSTGGGGASGEPTISATIDPTDIPAGSTATVTIEVTNFILEAPAGQPNEDGHGHYHVYLDDATGGDYLAAGESESEEIEIPSSTDPGPHTIRVSLGQNSHAPLNPPVETILDITVE